MDALVSFKINFITEINDSKKIHKCAKDPWSLLKIHDYLTWDTPYIEAIKLLFNIKSISKKKIYTTNKKILSQHAYISWARNFL